MKQFSPLQLTFDVYRHSVMMKSAKICLAVCNGTGACKLFTTGQAKLNSEHYVIKCVGSRYN